MNFLKKLAIIGDIEDVLTAGAALANEFTEVRPAVDKLEADFEAMVTALSFDGGAQVLEDCKALVASVETTYGPYTPEVAAFKADVAKLLADLGRGRLTAPPPARP